MANGTTSETREYDGRGRLLTTIDSYTGRIDYQYDLLGNRTRMTDPDNGVLTYAYDARNRLTEFTDPEGKTTTYAYDVMGRVISTALPNNTETVSVYDDDNRLSRMVTTSAKDGVLASFAYSYDAVGNKLTMTEEDGGITSYQYDAAYRLVHVEYPTRSVQLITNKNHGTTQGKGNKNGHHKADDPLPTAVSYTYDAAGNRIGESDDHKIVDYHYNAANQLLQVGEARYSYDENGNRTSRQDQDGVSRYSYTADNFLAGFESPDGENTEYGYDAMNRRVYKAADKNNITSYLYDGLEVLQEISGENAQKIASYYRANGRIITRQEYNVSQNQTGYQHRPEGRELFYAYDGLGSVVALSNHQGKEKTRYHYDAFGKVIDGDLTENQYTFTGRQLDPESGLYHFHFRQYDSEAGVWTTPDPIGVLGGVNLYGYVHNNPVNKIDFLGLDEPGNGFGPDGTGMSNTADTSTDTSNVNFGNHGQFDGIFGEIDFDVDIPDMGTGQPVTSVGVYGVSIDAFATIGIGVDFGFYYSSVDNSFGFYGGWEGGFGGDVGISFESGYADSVEALNGDYTTVEMGAGGVSVNISFGRDGSTVTTGNIGSDNSGAPCGHTGTGSGGTIDIF
jgi:RHS repeat-associated protein